MTRLPDDAAARELSADVRFANGYELTIGPRHADGRREVRVHDVTGSLAPVELEWRRGIGDVLRALNPARRAYARWLLSRAKPRSLAGHPRIALRVARSLRGYAYDDADVFRTDGAPADVEARRRAGFARLSATLRARAPRTYAAGAELAEGVSDAAFVGAYRVPFQYRELVRASLPVATVVDATDGARVRDLDGNWSYDLGGSYGVNLFGVEFYKQCIARGMERARDVGLVLGAYHPIVVENVRRLRAISGLDEVSFHMSGTEAVMQAVRLARYHTGRAKVVRFAGAYHGWWDGVQAGVGNPRPARDVYTLAEMSDDTLRVLQARDDIACVLVNPVQAMHPNGSPPSDSTLVASDRRAAFDRDAYAAWLRRLREVCTARRIVLIFDEVFLGFRLALGGAQEYFGVAADLVTYGKSLGGGLPVGVLAGRRSLMRRYRHDRPSDICLARGTFNAHPYVMATMHEFLEHVESPAVRAHYATLDAVWAARADRWNAALAAADVPVRVANMASVWTTLYTRPSPYNWMLQFYLRAAGLAMSWIGTGRFIFSHDLSDETVDAMGERFVSAAVAMRDDGWWWNDASLTNAAIKRRVAREVVRAMLWRQRAGAKRPSI